ncbi:hypothetical protein O3M35_007804 [Rhynocoris fuscipes]|uniref:DNA-binding protein Ets97D n=1 Tax=Rhynocoris fuscipes TaxID=488301 RepID=A0AAW1DD75_9HEMI
MGTQNKVLLLGPDFIDGDESTGQIGCETKLEVPNAEESLNEFLHKRIKLEKEELYNDDNIHADLVTNEFVVPEVNATTILPEENTGNINEEGIIMLHMDIRQPLSELKNILQEKLGTDLNDYSFTLQDSQLLESHKNLVDQCVQGEGLVQINVELKEENNEKRINIIDVLKPSEEYVELGEENADSEGEGEFENGEPSVNDDSIVRWTVDANFKKTQKRLNIPEDPALWDISHVRHWLLWAVRQFNLTKIKLSDWNINGTELVNMSLQTFREKVPCDPDSLFWTHLELLRKCKIVAVRPKPESIKSEFGDEDDAIFGVRQQDIGYLKQKNQEKILRMGVNCGQIQLWQFLLELLTDKKYRSIIQWLEIEGEFKLINPDVVAKLWGFRKNKPTMNYEKLSRALRYYYDGDMIAKVHGKRFVYKFVCDLKHLIGYSANELNALVIEAELNASQSLDLGSLHSIFSPDYLTMLS